MKLEYVGRVLARLQPFVRDRVIRRSRIERVLGALHSPPSGLRDEIERLLIRAGVAIEEDCVQARGRPLVWSNHPLTKDTPALVPTGIDSDAVAAARRRIERDRHISNHAKVLLKPEEEVGLAMLVRGASGKPLAAGGFGRLTGEPKAAAQCLLLHNQGLVHSVAQGYAPPGMSYEDLWQHGILGLIRAVELFDPHLGNKFSTYAMHWVRQSITRAIANESRMIRIPVHMYERVRKVWRTRSRMADSGGEPSIHQLALACGLSDEQVLECLMLGPQEILSLDAPVGAEGETTLGDLYDHPDPGADPEHEYEYVLLREQLHAVLATLSEREAEVILLRHGLIDGREKTLEEISKNYGVTRERVRQIESKAMDKLRRPPRSGVLKPYLYGTNDEPSRRRQ